MILLGLTGGIGSGKTVVAKLLQVMGIPVYDSDSCTKELYETDLTLKDSMIELFGPDLYMGGQLNRRMLAERIFSDATMLKQVNALVHPAVMRDFGKWTSIHLFSPAVVMESAILYEAGLDNQFDVILCVSAPEVVRIARTSNRENMTSKSIKARINHQLPEAELVRRANYVIINDGAHALIPQVQQLLNLILTKNSTNKLYTH